VDLAASIGTLVARWRDGQPAAITLTDEGTGVELVVAEPRGSALVHTELWPPRARRFAEILTFAAHRHVAGLEPSQADFERDVAFLRERQGAAGLEDLLEKMMDESAAAAMAEEPSEAVFEAGLATVKTHVEAARTGLAKEALERLIAAFPNVAQLWFRLGDMHHDAAAYGAAQSAWERCLALAPSHDAAALRLANLAAYFGRRLESIARLKVLVDADPKAQDPRVWLAQRYAEFDWMDLVLETFAPIKGELTDWKEARRRTLTARFDELRTQFAALASRQTPLSSQEAVHLARLAYSLGRLDVCAKLMNAFPEGAAKRADTHILQSDLRLRRDGVSEAIAYLEALAGPARDNPGLIVALARLHIAGGQPEAAAAALHALVRHTPRSDAFRLLCMLALSANDREVLRYATTSWCALHAQDTTASQWAIAEAWADRRILRLDDVAGTQADPPYPLIVQFWDSAERPIEVVQAMQTWQGRNPGVVHSVFDDGAARAFMAAFCAADVLACYEAAHHPAMQSDIFRLAFLSVRGGIYVDADDACIRDARGIFAALSAVELIAVRSAEAPPYVHNNFIAARPGCAIIADALRDAVDSVLKQRRGGQPVDIWQTTGPGLLTRAIARFTADPAHAGRVMLLNEVERHSFSMTQDMAYKHAEKGDWRLLDSTAAAASSVAQARPPSPPAAPTATDDVMMGWAMREVAPWQLNPVSYADAKCVWDDLNETHGWISLFQFAAGEVSVNPKPGHLRVPEMLRDRTARYLRFFRSVMPLLPPDFSTTVCMGMDDDLPGIFHVPMFCFQKKKGRNALLLPDIDFLNYDFYTAPEEQDRVAYLAKAPGAVFAGSTTGGAITPAVARACSIPRLRAAQYFINSAKVDFRLPRIQQCSTPEAEALLRAQIFCQKPILGWPDQLGRRMLISMDGNGAACSRVVLSLMSHSVLLKYDSDQVLYYFGGLQPWLHYVPIAQDSDVDRVIALEDRDPERFAKIAANGRSFAQTYLTAESTRHYTAMLLRLYDESFSEAATPLPVAVPPRALVPLPQGEAGMMLAHIQSRGDRTAPMGDWLGERSSTLAIEGLAMSLPVTFPAGFGYQVMLADGVLSEITWRGEYRGTRGENQPIYGVLITLDGEFAKTYDVDLEATFIDGSAVGPVSDGTQCVSSSAAQLESLRVIVSLKQT
jgi:predicted Zn-dependent protease